MINDIILPDDDTIKNLQKEYAKIKAKSFCDNNKIKVSSCITPTIPNYFLLIFTIALILKSTKDK